MDFIVSFTTSNCSSKFGCDISHTCTSISASLSSSRVDLNDSIRLCGSLRIKPTVSESRKGRLSTITLRTVVSSVANSLFSASTFDLPMRFIIVDFPALVYPTRATRIIFSRFLRCMVFCWSILRSFSLSSDIFESNIRLSVSIWVSPGPRIPIPPR